MYITRSHEIESIKRSNFTTCYLALRLDPIKSELQEIRTHSGNGSKVVQDHSGFRSQRRTMR